MPDIIRLIQQSNAGRDPERLAMKYAALREDAFAFLRGSNPLFLARLPAHKLLQDAPPAWACGDLHLENFSSYRADNELVYFDINDFDEAALAPCSLDPLRLATSILIAAPGLSIKPKEAHALCAGFIARYADALATGKARWVERETAEGMVRDLLDGLRERDREEFLDSRCERHGKTRRLRTDGDKALPATPKQREKVSAFMQEFASTQADPRFFKLIDVARRISGNASLGLERYVLLVRGKGSANGHVLLDLKQATPSALAGHWRVRQPAFGSEAARIVFAQQHMQAIPMAFLHAVKIGRRDFVLRELQPAQDRVTLSDARGKPRRLAGLLDTLADALAWSQLRSSGQRGAANADALIGFAARSKWRTQMLELATASSERLTADWHIYAKAYDDGVFRPAK